MLTGEFAGQWWLPDQPERRFGGVLKLVPGEEPTLHVMASISTLQERFASDPIEHPVILGTIATGKAVTLLRAFESGGQVNFMAPDSGDTVIRAARALVGDHFEAAEQARFRAITVRLSSLSGWLPPPLIKRDIDHDHGRLARAVLTFVPEPDIEVRLPFGRLSLGFDYRLAGNQRDNAEITQGTWVTARANRRNALDWWLKRLVKPLRYLLALATERPIELTEMYLQPTANGTENQVELVWASDRLPDMPSSALDAHQMLFWYADLADRLDSALASWFAAVEVLEDVFDQYFATFNTTRSYVETRFLMTVGAAEAYHRERIGGTDASVGVHRERVSQARKGVAPEHREWLDSRLGNEPALLQRIVDLCVDVPQVAGLVVGEDLTAFARAIRDARNFRTHMDRRRLAPGGRLNLVRLSAQLGVILEAVMLRRELGFEPPDIASRMERASRLLRLARAAERKVVG
ncbi:MAG: HEPN domain-containing protein [Solirubrobacterales bacterium]